MTQRQPTTTTEYLSFDEFLNDQEEEDIKINKPFPENVICVEDNTTKLCSNVVDHVRENIHIYGLLPGMGRSFDFRFHDDKTATEYRTEDNTDDVLTEIENSTSFNQIIVRGVPDGLENTVEIYLESKNKGGGKIELIQYKRENNSMLITFNDGNGELE